MENCIAAPLLSRVKSWQLIGLGISGWCTLYSVAIITWSAWGARSITIGHAQGACFALAMALASFEVKRYKKPAPIPEDPLRWVSGVSTEHLNQTLAQAMQQRELRVEPCHALETELGIGVHAINAGRIMIFETARWKEPVIDAAHVQTTEENRKKVFAARAIIVGVGNPDQDAQDFAKALSVSFLGGTELKEMLVEKPAGEKAHRPGIPLVPKGLGFLPRLAQCCRSAFASVRRGKSKSKRRRSNW